MTGLYDRDGKAIEDLRLYLNNIELTPFLKLEFSRLLDGENRNQFVEQYRLALERHYDQYTTVNETQAEMETRGAELLAAPLGRQFADKIGDFTQGWSGHLGVVNFLYSDVKMPRIRLSRLLDSYNTTIGSMLRLHQFDQITLTFSSGPRGSEPSLSKKGGLSFTVITFNTNPLLQEIRDLDTEIQSLRRHTEERFQTISERLDAFQENFQSAVARLEGAIAQVRETLTDRIVQETSLLRANLQSATDRVSSLERLAQERSHSIRLRRSSDGAETVILDGETGDIVLR